VLSSKERSVALETLTRYSEADIGDTFTCNESGATHGVLGKAWYNGEALVLHQRVGDRPVIEATEIEDFFSSYTIQRKRT
jgi:hypothetical protein